MNREWVIIGLALSIATAACERTDDGSNQSDVTPYESLPDYIEKEGTFYELYENAYHEIEFRPSLPVSFEPKEFREDGFSDLTVSLELVNVDDAVWANTTICVLTKKEVQLEDPLDIREEPLITEAELNKDNCDDNKWMQVMPSIKSLEVSLMIGNTIAHSFPLPIDPSGGGSLLGTGDGKILGFRWNTKTSLNRSLFRKVDGMSVTYHFIDGQLPTYE